MYSVVKEILKKKRKIAYQKKTWTIQVIQRMYIPCPIVMTYPATKNNLVLIVLFYANVYISIILRYRINTGNKYEFVTCRNRIRRKNINKDTHGHSTDISENT